MSGKKNEKTSFIERAQEHETILQRLNDDDNGEYKKTLKKLKSSTSTSNKDGEEQKASEAAN